MNLISSLQILGNQARGNMSGKPKLHYFNGRGRMETIRWLLATAGVEVCLCFFILRACDKYVLLLFLMKSVTEQQLQTLHLVHC